MNDTPTPREKFEKWIESIGYSTARGTVYISVATNIAWEAWQEASKELIAAREEIKAITEQRDKALQKIKNQAERIAYLEGATNHATGTPLSKAIEQRDRLAEAIRKHKTALSFAPDFCDFELYEALQSLNQDHTVDANDMIAAVKGDNHES